MSHVLHNVALALVLVWGIRVYSMGGGHLQKLWDTLCSIDVYVSYIYHDIHVCHVCMSCMYHTELERSQIFGSFTSHNATAGARLVSFWLSPVLRLSLRSRRVVWFLHHRMIAVVIRLFLHRALRVFVGLLHRVCRVGWSTEVFVVPDCFHIFRFSPYRTSDVAVRGGFSHTHTESHRERKYVCVCHFISTHTTCTVV